MSQILPVTLVLDLLACQLCVDLVAGRLHNHADTCLEFPLPRSLDISAYGAFSDIRQRFDLFELCLHLIQSLLRAVADLAQLLQLYLFFADLRLFLADRLPLQP